MAISLQHGTYLTPVFVRRARVEDELRGIVTIIGLSDGPLPWPICEQHGRCSLIVYRGLAKALAVESADAIAKTWGVPVETVKRWQSADDGPRVGLHTPDGLLPPWPPRAACGGRIGRGPNSRWWQTAPATLNSPSRLRCVGPRRAAWGPERGLVLDQQIALGTWFTTCPLGEVSRSKIRLALCRCFFGAWGSATRS